MTRRVLPLFAAAFLLLGAPATSRAAIPFTGSITVPGSLSAGQGQYYLAFVLTDNDGAVNNSATITNIASSGGVTLGRNTLPAGPAGPSVISMSQLFGPFGVGPGTSPTAPAPGGPGQNPGVDPNSSLTANFPVNQPPQIFLGDVFTDTVFPDGFDDENNATALVPFDPGAGGSISFNVLVSSHYTGNGFPDSFSVELVYDPFGLDDDYQTFPMATTAGPGNASLYYVELLPENTWQAVQSGQILGGVDADLDGFDDVTGFPFNPGVAGITIAAANPEPASCLLWGFTVAGAGFYFRRRKNRLVTA